MKCQVATTSIQWSKHRLREERISRRKVFPATDKGQRSPAGPAQSAPRTIGTVIGIDTTNGIPWSNRAISNNTIINAFYARGTGT